MTFIHFANMFHCLRVMGWVVLLEYLIKYSMNFLINVISNVILQVGSSIEVHHYEVIHTFFLVLHCLRLLGLDGVDEFKV